MDCTRSSASLFAVFLQDIQVAMVIGEPTGAAPSSFGASLTFSLPLTGDAFTVSHKRFTRPDSRRDPADTLSSDV